jgi:hypothetical protein
MTTPNMGAPLTGCVTIDSAKNAYLDNARAGNPSAAANAYTETAASNFLICEGQSASPATASLVGHGAEGDIDTGSDHGECITIHNERTWVPLLQPLSGKLNELFLYGCSVGAGTDGATLLFDIAKVVNTNVYAPTGIIYCKSDGSFYLEPKAVWQVAKPNLAPPKPIPAPTHSVSLAMTHAKLTMAGNLVPTSLDHMTATYTPLPHGQPRDAGGMAREVLWDSPHEEDGEPGAKVTGRLEVNFKDAGKRTFLVHGHSLLRDESAPKIFYDTTKVFQAQAARH